MDEIPLSFTSKSSYCPDLINADRSSSWEVIEDCEESLKFVWELLVLHNFRFSFNEETSLSIGFCFHSGNSNNFSILMKDQICLIENGW